MTAPYTSSLPPVTDPADYEFDGKIFRQQYAEYLRLRQASIGQRLATMQQGRPDSTIASYAPPTNYQLLDDDKLIGAAMSWGATRAQAQATSREDIVKWLEFNRSAARPTDATSNDMINGAAALSMFGLGAVQGLNRGLRAIPLVGEAYDRYLGGHEATQKLAGLEELVRASTPESIRMVLSGEDLLGHVGAMWAPTGVAFNLVGRAGVAATGVGALGIGGALARTSPIARGAAQGIATTFALEGGSEEAKDDPLLWYTIGAGLGVLAPLGGPAMQWGAEQLNRFRSMMRGQSARASRAYTPGWTRPPESDATGVRIEGPTPTGPAGAPQLMPGTPQLGPGTGALDAAAGQPQLNSGVPRLAQPSSQRLLPPGAAIESAEAQALGFTKADMVLNAPNAETLLASPVLDDVTVLRAAAESNPGGVTLVHSITDPGALLEYAVKNKLFLNFATRNGRQTALLSDGYLSSASLAAEFERYGVFTGQTVRSNSGTELTVQSITPDGQAVVRPSYAGATQAAATVPVSELSPSVRSTATQAEPALWDDFLETASRRAYAAVQELTGTQHPLMADQLLRTNMVKYLNEYLDSAGITSQGERARVGAYFNERYVDSYKQLAPAEVAATAQAEAALLSAPGASIIERPIAYLDELASSRGFVITPTGDGRFELIDTLGEQMPPSPDLPATQSRVWDTPQEVAAYLHQLDRELPDITPLGDVPVEAFGTIAGDVPTNVPASSYPRGLANTLEELAEDMGVAGVPDQALMAEAQALRDEAASDGLAALREFDLQRRGGGRGPGDSGDGGWGGPEQPQLGRGVPRAINTINRATLQLSNQRRLFAVLDDMLEEAGAGDLRLYGEGQAILRTEDARSNMFSQMTDDFTPIVRSIRVSMRRNGTWTRIYEIEDDGLRLLAADRAGLNKAEIAAFDATAQMMHKWFGETGLAAERELRRYMPHIQKAVATGKWEPVETLMRAGKVHPMTEAFMLKVRTGAINVRELDPEQLFITYASSLANEASGYNTALKAMTDKWTRLKQEWPEVGPVAQYVDGWLHSLQYGHTAGADAALDAAHVVLQRMVGPSITRHNTRQLVNFGLNMNYKALLGLRLPTVIRNLGQIALATPRLPTQIPEVLREFITPAGRHTIMERAIALGNVSLQPQRSVAPGAIRDLQEIAARELEGPFKQAATLTPREKAVAGMLAKVEDLIPSWMLKKQVQPMYWFSQTDELMRAVVGEAGLRKAQSALSAYARSDRGTGALQVLMEDSGALSFYPASQREFKKKVAAGLFNDAAIDLSREQVAASMFFYGPGRGPLIGNTLGGKLGTQISSYALNTLQTLEEVFRYGGSLRTKVAMGATFAGVSLALAEAQRRTGWSFNKLNPFTGAVPSVGGPVLRATLDIGKNAARGTSLALEGASQMLTGDLTGAMQGPVADALQQAGQAAGTAADMFNPFRGAFETLSGLEKAQRSPLPGTATSRYLLLGDKSTTPDLERYNPFYNPSAGQQQTVPHQSPVRGGSYGLPSVPQRQVTPMSPREVADTAWFNSLPPELQAVLREQQVDTLSGGGAMQ